MTEASVQALTARFCAMIAGSNNWYLALLEAVREWPVARETANGASSRYLIAGEALDLAQISVELIEAAKDLIPVKEQINLLFYGRPPVALTPEELKGHLGEEKYKQHLNFFYGVTVEEALQEITAEEVRKEERGVRARTDDWVTNESFLRIYGKTQPELISLFRAAKDGLAEGISLSKTKELSYWLFKHRLAHSDPEKSASDTKKALIWLQGHADRSGQCSGYHQ